MKKIPADILLHIRKTCSEFDYQEIGIIATTLIGHTLASIECDELKVRYLKAHIDGLEAFSIAEGIDIKMEFESYMDKMH